MRAIYEPAGRAREYSPLALNLYSSCNHGCQYCFVNGIPGFKDRNISTASPIPRPGILDAMRKDVLYLERKQVLLSFTGDPYCKAEPECRITRNALQILLDAGFPVAVLTKGGNKCLRDLELFKSFKGKIKIGATLTFLRDSDSKEWEPKAALPQERLDTLKILHDAGIKTWVSIEPVIKPDQSLKLIEASLPFVDSFKIGKWNHDTRASEINWPNFLEKAITILESKKVNYYIKDDLSEACPKIKIKKIARAMDALAL